jgi:phosphoribosyl 1,2-cyclic phosphodiesterase
LRHDSGATFGFRFECQGWALAYVADLGSWTPELAGDMANVDVLCVEFNHDVDMEHASGRPPELIARVLGADGHLSNDQAAALLQQVLRLSTPGRLRHLVQLHLSRECNCPSLAVQSAWSVLNGEAGTIQIHTASQTQAGPVLVLDFPSRNGTAPPAVMTQRWLPGWEV